MEEHYISKLHPVVDYGAGVFLLLIGEFCLPSLGVLQASGWTGRGRPIHAAVSTGCSGGSWREMMENLFLHLPLLSAFQLGRALLSALQCLVVMLKACRHTFASVASQVVEISRLPLMLASK